MIVAFVGTINDESNTPISGNGKTCSMTGVSYLDNLDGREVWSNYYTSFSDKIIGMQQMIELIGDTPHPDLILCVSEMQQVLNSIGSSYDQILFIDGFASQLRKLDVDLYYDTQRFMNIHKRLRIHTDIIYLPYKTHLDNTPCNFNRCMKPHKIFLYAYKPMMRKYRCVFDASEVGKLYDTKEIVIDKLVVPSKKKVKENL
jgi:hypothetical protein